MEDPLDRLLEVLEELDKKLEADPDFRQRRTRKLERARHLYIRFGAELIAFPPEAVAARLTASRN